MSIRSAARCPEPRNGIGSRPYLVKDDTKCQSAEIPSYTPEAESDGAGAFLIRWKAIVSVENRRYPAVRRARDGRGSRPFPGHGCPGGDPRALAAHAGPLAGDRCGSALPQVRRSRPVPVAGRAGVGGFVPPAPYVERGTTGDPPFPGPGRGGVPVSRFGTDRRSDGRTAAPFVARSRIYGRFGLPCFAGDF